MKAKKAIKTGLDIAVVLLAALCVIAIATLGWEAFQSRTGYPGGEVLILPMIILLFYAGWIVRGDFEDCKKCRLIATDASNPICHNCRTILTQYIDNINCHRCGR
ncbi:MAG: hypothetical protein DDT20_00869 [Firmicutes bacterium]|nr:hypothetical protein [Bacillota bacterium]MBT9176549.1 hypothetical protein [Bacillota bacterium]